MEWGGGLAGIQTAIPLGGNMDGIYWARDLRAVHTALTVRTDNQNRQIHGSVTTHTDGFVPFSAHAKQKVRLILMKYIVN